LSRKGDSKYATKANIERGQRLRIDLLRALALYYRTNGYGPSIADMQKMLKTNFARIQRHTQQLQEQGYVFRPSQKAGYYLSGKYPQDEHFGIVLKLFDTSQLEWELLTGTPISRRPGRA
jgi:hypothetical protein